MSILIKITSDESPQSIFKKQADAQAMEEWARSSVGSPMPVKDHIAYLKKTGERFMEGKVKKLILKLW